MELIALFFSELRWQDLLDIAINSYILFRFYILFRGTNVLRVLFALACVWFAQRITFSMGLIVSIVRLGHGMLRRMCIPGWGGCCWGVDTYLCVGCGSGDRFKPIDSDYYV